MTVVLGVVKVVVVMMIIEVFTVAYKSRIENFIRKLWEVRTNQRFKTFGCTPLPFTLTIPDGLSG